jgi:CBS domain-containing protein
VRVGNLLVRDVMTAPVEALDVDALLSDGVARMRRLNVSFLPVQSGDEIIGVVTERDTTSCIGAAGYDASRTTIRSAMTTEFAYCFANQEAMEAAQIMENRHLRQLLVLDEEQRLVGILSVEDIAVKAGDERLAGRILRRTAGV